MSALVRQLLFRKLGAVLKSELASSGQHPVAVFREVLTTIAENPVAISEIGRVSLSPNFDSVFEPVRPLCSEGSGAMSEAAQVTR